MNLVEVLVAGAVFAGAMGGSAQLLAMTGQWSLAAQQRQRQRDGTEAVMAAAEALLQRQAQAAPLPWDCASAAADLAADLSQELEPQLAGMAEPPDLEVAERIDGTGLLQLEGPAGEPPRQRLISPSALGLCRP